MMKRKKYQAIWIAPPIQLFSFFKIRIFGLTLFLEMFWLRTGVSGGEVLRFIDRWKQWRSCGKNIRRQELTAPLNGGPLNSMHIIKVFSEHNISIILSGQKWTRWWHYSGFLNFFGKQNYRLRWTNHKET